MMVASRLARGRKRLENAVLAGILPFLSSHKGRIRHPYQGSMIGCRYGAIVEARRLIVVFGFT
jgi:hypothetical protein